MMLGLRLNSKIDIPTVWMFTCILTRFLILPLAGNVAPFGLSSEQSHLCYFFKSLTSHLSICIKDVNLLDMGGEDNLVYRLYFDGRKHVFSSCNYSSE